MAPRGVVDGWRETGAWEVEMLTLGSSPPSIAVQLYSWRLARRMACSLPGFSRHSHSSSFKKCDSEYDHFLSVSFYHNKVGVAKALFCACALLN